MLTITQSFPLKWTSQMNRVHFKGKDNHGSDTVHFGSRITNEQLDRIQNNGNLSCYQKAEQVNAIILDGKDTKGSIESLGKIVTKTQYTYERELVAESLTQIVIHNKDAPHEAMTYLKKMINDNDIFVKSHVAKSFGQIVIHNKDFAQEAMTYLKEMSKDNKPIVRSHVAESFGQIGKDALDELREMRKDTHPSVRNSVVKSFGQLGMDALDELKKMKKDTDSDVKSHVAKSFAKIGLTYLQFAQEARREISSIDLPDYAKTMILSDFDKQQLDIKTKLLSTKRGLQRLCLNALGVPIDKLPKQDIDIPLVVQKKINQDRIIDPNLWGKLTKQVSKIKLQKNKLPIFPR